VGSGMSDDQWFSSLHDTGWLGHIRQIMSGAARIADLVSRGKPVMIHCSDGWDRTSQLSSVAQILLDPDCRTIMGMTFLIEKEWCAFGHKFGTRIGHFASKDKDERSPVFLQFLDCVHQLMKQFPHAFQFNQRFLLLIVDAVYSCRFGTFIFDTLKERAQARANTKTTPLWYFVSQVEDLLLNDDYVPPVERPQEMAEGDFWLLHHLPDLEAVRLRPDCSQKAMTLWNEYFFRYDPRHATVQDIAAEHQQFLRAARKKQKDTLEKTLASKEARINRLIDAISASLTV